MAWYDFLFGTREDTDGDGTPDVVRAEMPYEILIRFGGNGELRGAHVQMRRVVIVQGEMMKDEILPAAPISTANLPAESVMSNALALALADNNRLRERLAELENAD